MFDDLPKPKTDNAFPRDLTNMSVDEIQDYINDLKAEITRAQTDITKKKNSAAAAESVFKS